MGLQRQLQQIFTLNASTGYRILPIHHVIFWLIYFLFNFLRWGSYYSDYMLSLKGNIIGFPIHIVLSYFAIFYLVPKFIKNRKFLSFALSLVAAIFLMVFLKYYLTRLLVGTNVWPEGPEYTSNFSFNYALTMMLGEFYVIAFVTAIKITLDWMRESNRVVSLEKIQLETELKFLRTQVSPHFLFNTLNNIYSLSLEKSSKASEIILKLSELMRYMLYDTKENKQDLIKELHCIQNYLELERIRYGDSLQIEMEVSGDIEGKKISSMLLIPFVENAFKHGANKSREGAKINIDLKVVEGFLFFNISNSLPQQINGTPGKGPGGIGISNVRKRLELGYNKGEYELRNYENGENYIVELKLKLR